MASSSLQENGVTATAPTPGNKLLMRLPAKERNKVLAGCELVELAFGAVLCEAEAPVSDVYFPLTGFISLTISVGTHPPLEMGLIGNEGMLGVSLVLGVNTAPLRAVVQGAGGALRMPAQKFRRTLRECPVLPRNLNRYMYVLNMQLAQSTACTRFHEVEPRLARWLLMTQDCVDADHFHLTHQFLADMLGVQRSAISIAAGGLQRKNLLSYTRGNIHILDRKGLEASACECYQATVDDYLGLFP